ncbi:MAG: alpha-galactosidase, partial [Roseiflexus castenholzii]
MTIPATLDQSTAGLVCLLRLIPHIGLMRLGLAHESWALDSSALFAAVIDGQLFDTQTPGAQVRHVSESETPPGMRHVCVELAYADSGIVVAYHIVTYADSAVLETWIVVQNEGDVPRRVTRLDSLALDLPPDVYHLYAFTGAWGAEFEPQRMLLNSAITLESRSGRSSHGHHPWLTLVRNGRSLMSGIIAWSGNWVIRFTPKLDGVLALSGGLHDWEFAVDLAPGASVV